MSEPVIQFTAWGDRSAACVLCGCRDRILLKKIPEVAEGSPPPATPAEVVGVCEACTVLLYWQWRTLARNALPAGPSEGRGEPAIVRVVLCRLKAVAGDVPPSPEVPESHELAYAEQEGLLDLPGIEIRDREKITAAAARALGACGLVTWPSAIEPLYSALAPRGRLAAIVLCTAYTRWEAGVDGEVERPRPAEGEPPHPVVQWREWGPCKHVAPMAPLYHGLRDVLALRLAAHGKQEPRLACATTEIRRAAAEYIYLQQALRSRQPGADASASEILRRSMSADERLWASRLTEEDLLADERRRQDAEALAAEGGEPDSPGEEAGEVDAGPEDAPPGPDDEEGGGDEISFDGEPGGRE